MFDDAIPVSSSQADIWLAQQFMPDVPFTIAYYVDIVGAVDVDVLAAPFIPVVRDVLVETLFASGSNTLIFPVQDVFGWRDRINEPATVSDSNWTYRLPWPVDRLATEPDAQEPRSALRAWAKKYGLM